MRRRSCLVLASGAVAGLAGCSNLLSTDGGGPPEVGEPSGEPDRQLTVELTVLEGDEPLVDTRVIYHDRGGSYDRLEGTTGSGGRIVFHDSVGPPPANRVEIEVPDHETVVDLGNHNGGKTIEREIDVAVGTVREA